MLAERKREKEPFSPSSSFQFKFASTQERGAFHSQMRPCLSRLDQRRTFRHLINLPTGVHVYQVQEHWDPELEKSPLSSLNFFHHYTSYTFFPFDFHVNEMLKALIITVF